MAGWAAYAKYRDLFKSNLSICLTRHVFNTCVLPAMTYGANKHINKLAANVVCAEKSIFLPYTIFGHHFICKLTNNIFEATAGIIVANMSDHLPYSVCIGYVKAKHNVPKYMCRIQMKTKKGIMTELTNPDVCDKLNNHNNANRNVNTIQFNSIQFSLFNSIQFISSTHQHFIQ